MDITLGRLLHAGAVCLPAARAYGDHCAKVSWITTLASLDKAGCGHLNVLATRSVVVAIANEAIVVYRWMQKANNVLLHDFWGPHSHDAAVESLWAVQAQKVKGKTPVEGPRISERGGANRDTV